MLKNFVCKEVASLCLILAFTTTKSPARQITASAPSSDPNVVSDFFNRLSCDLVNNLNDTKNSCFAISATIQKKSSTIKNNTINPNPVSDGMAAIRFITAITANYDFRVVDLPGKIGLHEQNNLPEGNSSVSINDLDRLSAGEYVMRLSNGDEILSAKFPIAR